MDAQTATIAFCVLLAGLALFQLALIAGAPLGRYAWGGGHERLPAGFRIGSAVSIVIYALFAAIVLERAGMMKLFPDPAVAGIGIWVIVGYSALGIVMNAISRSVRERIVMTPVAAALFGLSLAVALLARP